MRYQVTIEGRTRVVDVRTSPDGGLEVALDGVERPDVDIFPVPGGVSLRLGRRVFDVVAGGSATARTLAAGPARAVVQVQSERTAARGRRRGKGGRASKELRAPMPGRILQVQARAGDEVCVGQPLVVIEAMKMENELRAEASAKVASVEVSEGDTVDADTVLVTFE